MMRVTFVLPGRGLFGGIRVVVAYGNALIERGHEVTIVCLKKRRPRRPVGLVGRLLRDVRVATGWTRDHLHDFRGHLLSARMERLGQKVPQGDVVVATHWSTANAVAKLSEAAGLKYYFIQGYEGHFFDPSKVDPTWRLAMRKIVVSRWLQSMASEKFGDDAAILVPNGIDRRLFDAPQRALGRPPAVGFVYSPVPSKGASVAFRSIAIAREEVPQLRVIAFGARPPTRDAPVPAGMRFHLRPGQRDLRAIYAAADIWLCASENEGFALPPLEAMACRCPVVVTRCGGPADFVKDGENGYLVEVGDAGAMADRIIRIISDEARWRRMSNEAYRTVRKFNLDRSIVLFEKALMGRERRDDPRGVDPISNPLAAAADRVD